MNGTGVKVFVGPTVGGKVGKGVRVGGTAVAVAVAVGEGVGVCELVGVAVAVGHGVGVLVITSARAAGVAVNNGPPCPGTGLGWMTSVCVGDGTGEGGAKVGNGVRVGISGMDNSASVVGEISGRGVPGNV